jgi:predicted CXXCH cytochrome family protein
MTHWGRHPGTNTEWGASRPINATGANTNPAWWVGGTFGTPRLPFIVNGANTFDAAGIVAPDNEVFCLTCHKAHGSTYPFALRWNYGTPGSPTASDGCQQCHKEP